MTPQQWLEAKNINIRINKNNIIEKLNLTLKINETTVILGPNGSGKSSLIKLLSRSYYPIYSKNTYFKILGKTKISLMELRSKIGFVYNELDTRISNKEKCIDVVLSGYFGSIGLSRNYRYDSIQYSNALSLLKNMSLDDLENQKYRELSDGQKRRVLIARALINQPSILILDEPTSMLDLKSMYELCQTLEKLVKERITILYVTNNMESIIQATQRVILLKKGRILKDGHPDQIINSFNISNLYDINVEVFKGNGYWRSYPS